MPEVSGDVSLPSVGGVDVDVDAPSVDVGASAPSASLDLPGECKLLLVGFWIIVVLSFGHVNMLHARRTLCVGKVCSCMKLHYRRTSSDADMYSHLVPPCVNRLIRIRILVFV